MIITVANPKGGTGKTTLVRALSGTAAHAGNSVFIIDADSRANTMRWVEMSKQLGLWPQHLEAIRCLDADRIYTIAQEQKQAGKIVFIDIEGTTNENLFAGLFAADVLVIPMQTTQDDVIAGMQLALNHLPVVEQERKIKVPCLVVINQHDFVTGRAKVHEPLRDLLRQSGLKMAAKPITRRSSYQNIGAAGTLQTIAKRDDKATAEVEGLLAEVLSLYRETLTAAA